MAGRRRRPDLRAAMAPGGAGCRPSAAGGYDGMAGGASVARRRARAARPDLDSPPPLLVRRFRPVFPRSKHVLRRLVARWGRYLPNFMGLLRQMGARFPISP